MKQINLTFGECLLLIEALQMAAGRHETTSRYKPAIAGPHDRKAAAMRALRTKLIQARPYASQGCLLPRPPGSC